MAGEVGPTIIFELADRIVRSWWTIVAGICFGLTGGMIALSQMPVIYQASAKIWIRSPEVPGSVVRSNIRDEQNTRIMTFKDSILEQDYMSELVRRTFGMPKSPEILARFEARISGAVRIAPVKAEGLAGYWLAYSDVDPERAALVVNTLVELFIDQNSETRVTAATRTAGAIETILAEKKAAFDEVDRRVTAFKTTYPYETEKQLEPNIRLRDSKIKQMETAIAKLEKIDADLEQARENLEKAKSGVPVADPTQGPGGASPLEQKVAKIEGELDRIKLTYSERHPSYTKKLRELEDVKAEIVERDAQALAAAAARQAGTEGEEGEVEAPVEQAKRDPALVPHEKKVHGLEQDRAAQQASIDRLQETIEEYERRIEATPTVQLELNKLMLEYQIKSDDYRKLERSFSAAEGSTDLERSEFGQRMEAIEQARVPSRPVSPEPLRVILVGLGIGVAVFVTPVALIHLLNPLIVSEAGLAGAADVPVLVSVPQIRTDRNKGVGRNHVLLNLALAFCSASVLAGTFYYFYYYLG